MFSTFKNTILAAFILFCSTSSVLAASISIVPSGNPASFSVEGSGMDGVAGIQLNVTYDSASLATPTVTQSALVAGAMLAANTTQPGIIKIAIISTRAFSGSGQIATISFASKKGSGGIISITTDMIDSKGAAIASSGSVNLSSGTAATEIITTPGIPFSQPSTTTTNNTASTAATTTNTTAATTATQSFPGTITLPADLQQRAESQPAPSSTVPAFSREPAESIIAEEQNRTNPDSKAVETPQLVVYEGILERFKLYSGSKKFSTMVTLFDKKTAQTIHQEPAILLSNGRNIATLSIDIPATTNSSPSFAVNGGKLLSFKQDKQILDRRIIEILPDVGSVRTTVIIIAGAERFEFPLTVTPPVKTKLTLDESGWNKFLKEIGTVKAPLHDFNSDGVRDYMDEFIFIANCLAKKTTPPKPVSTPNKSAK